MHYFEYDSTRNLDLIALGRVCIDFNPLDYYKPWEECETFKKYVGGSPANTVVGLARLGKKCGFIGCISKDKMGEFCKKFFQTEGIDTSHIMYAKHGESLGLAFTEIPDKEHSSLIMYRDNVADLQLEPENVTGDYIRRAKILLISGTALAASPSRDAALKAVQLAKKNKTDVIFDIDYRDYTWLSKEDVAIYGSIVANEACVIMGSREEFDLLGGDWHSFKDDQNISDFWFAKNCKITIIKHGKEGSAAFTDDGEVYKVKPFPVEKIKSFGGGDGYSSAFINGLLEKWPLEKCLNYGSASASMLVASLGCSSDMPDYKKLTEFIKEKEAQFGATVTRIK